MYIHQPLIQRLKHKLRTRWRQLVRPRYIVNHGVRLDVHTAAVAQSATIRQALYADTYESAEISVLARILQPDDAIIEIGAGIGLVTTYLSQTLGADKVFSYEANPALREQIEQTLALNNQPATHLTAAGVSAQAGERVFYVTYPNFWSSTFGPVNSGTFCGIERTQEMSVAMRGLDEELARTKANVVLMDIEGGEHELLCNSQLPGVDKLVFEVHPYVIGDDKVTEIISHLQELGFMLHLRLSHPQVLCFSRLVELNATSEAANTEH